MDLRDEHVTRPYLTVARDKKRFSHIPKHIPKWYQNDPDASYGLKGCGYSAHVTETCNNKRKSLIITDYEVHGAGRSDMGKAIGVVKRLASSGMKPKTLFAAGGYPSVPTVLEITEQSVEFMSPVSRVRLLNDVITISSNLMTMAIY